MQAAVGTALVYHIKPNQYHINLNPLMSAIICIIHITKPTLNPTILLHSEVTEETIKVHTKHGYILIWGHKLKKK